MNYLNDGLPFLVNCSITEYDIRSGNVSIMSEYGLIPQETINELKKLSKQERVRRVGILQINNKPFAKALEQGFNTAVKDFIEQNDLDIDVDVLAVKRDAVFVINKSILKPKVGSHIEFRPKGQYHAYLQLGRYEFYFGDKDGDHNAVTIKNFVQEEKDVNHALQKLSVGMIAFLQEFIEKCEGTNMNRREVYTYLRDFITYYKHKELDIEYYREFTRDACFRVVLDDGTIEYMDYVPDELEDSIDITFNLVTIIIPLLQVLI